MEADPSHRTVSSVSSPLAIISAPREVWQGLISTRFRSGCGVRSLESLGAFGGARSLIL